MVTLSSYLNVFTGIKKKKLKKKIEEKKIEKKKIEKKKKIFELGEKNFLNLCKTPKKIRLEQNKV